MQAMMALHNICPLPINNIIIPYGAAIVNMPLNK